MINVSIEHAGQSCNLKTYLLNVYCGHNLHHPKILDNTESRTLSGAPTYQAPILLFMYGRECIKYPPST